VAKILALGVSYPGSIPGWAQFFCFVKNLLISGAISAIFNIILRNF
jgi:hypothetical protein